jgi:hypothetical protein
VVESILRAAPRPSRERRQLLLGVLLKADPLTMRLIVHAGYCDVTRYVYNVEEQRNTLSGRIYNVSIRSRRAFGGPWGSKDHYDRFGSTRPGVWDGDGENALEGVRRCIR